MSSLERGEGAKTIREGNTERKGEEKENDRERGGDKGRETQRPTDKWRRYDNKGKAKFEAEEEEHNMCGIIFFSKVLLNLGGEL